MVDNGSIDGPDENAAPPSPVGEGGAETQPEEAEGSPGLLSGFFAENEQKTPRARLQGAVALHQAFGDFQDDKRKYVVDQQYVDQLTAYTGQVNAEFELLSALDEVDEELNQVEDRVAAKSALVRRYAQYTSRYSKLEELLALISATTLELVKSFVNTTAINNSRISGLRIRIFAHLLSIFAIPISLPYECNRCEQQYRSPSFLQTFNQSRSHNLSYT